MDILVSKHYLDLGATVSITINDKSKSEWFIKLISEEENIWNVTKKNL